MKLVPVKVDGIYPSKDGLLPPKMAQMAPDAATALSTVRIEIEGKGGRFRLSDCYRDSAMQDRAHQDYVTGRKKAYSPPSGSSMHEAGRAIDLDLASLIHPGSVPRGYQVFDENVIRAIFEKHGWTFIAPAGNPHQVDVKESWHIEFRAQFQVTYNTTMAKTRSHSAAYKAMTRAAIADLKN